MRIARSTKTPIDKLWLSHEIGAFVGRRHDRVRRNAAAQSRRHAICSARSPGSYIANPASSGGYTPGAAFGAKLAAPDKHVIAVTGDGFYMFSTANAALWAGAALQRAVHGRRLSEPRLQHRHAASLNDVSRLVLREESGYEGGTFDRRWTSRKKPKRAARYGENVTDPAEIRAGAATRARSERPRPPGRHLRLGRTAVLQMSYIATNICLSLAIHDFRHAMIVSITRLVRWGRGLGCSRRRSIAPGSRCRPGRARRRRRAFRRSGSSGCRASLRMP